MSECCSPCEKCGEDKASFCPCGECMDHAHTKACPKCETEQFNRELKMRGTPVCKAYVKTQLGST
jgi:hypothetical protein